jgi:hypothetical protein
MCVVPYIPYQLPRRQFGTNLKPPTLFSACGEPGAPLIPSSPQNYNDIDDSTQSVFENCRTKITYVIQVGISPNPCLTFYILSMKKKQIAGYEPFKRQKYAYAGRKGTLMPYDREKVVKQVAEVMEVFIEHGTTFFAGRKML